MPLSNRSFDTYKPYLKPLARALRQQSTWGERMLWSRLRGKQLLGYKFLRQAELLSYIVDFLCRELKLIIEIDGRSHEYQFEEDQTRQRTLESVGYTVLRFSEIEVRKNITQVLRTIENWIEATHAASHPPVTPLEGGDSAAPAPR